MLKSATKEQFVSKGRAVSASSALKKSATQKNVQSLNGLTTTKECATVSKESVATKKSCGHTHTHTHGRCIRPGRSTTTAATPITTMMMIKITMKTTTTRCIYCSNNVIRSYTHSPPRPSFFSVFLLQLYKLLDGSTSKEGKEVVPVARA